MRVVTRWLPLVCSGPKWLKDWTTFFAGWLSSVDIGWSSGTVKSARWTVMVWAGRSALAGNMLRWKCEETSLQPSPLKIHPTTQLLATISSTIFCRWHVQQRDQGRLHQSPVTHRVVLYFIKHTSLTTFQMYFAFFQHKWKSKTAAQNHLQMKGVTHFSLVVFTLGVVQVCTQWHPKMPKRCLVYNVLISNAIEKDACRHRYVTPFSIYEPNRENTFSVTKFVDSDS